MKTGGLRTAVASLTFLGLLASGMPAAALGTAPLLVPLANDEAQFVLGEDSDSLQFRSYISLQPAAPDENLNRDPWIQCESLDDPACEMPKPGYTWLITRNAPLCEGDEGDCIEGLTLSRNGVALETIYVGPVPGQSTFAADAKTRLPAGGAAIIFSVPDAPHAGGDLYLVSAKTSLGMDPKTGFFQTGALDLTVQPISIKPAGYGLGFPGTMTCIWDNQDSCGVAHSFPMDLRARVSIRVSTEIGGWFLGRMKAPNIEIKPFSERNQIITVEANPVEVARFSYKLKKSEVTFEDRKAAGNTGSMGTFEGDGPVRIGNAGLDESSFGMVEYFRPKVKDTAVGVTTHWSLRTTSHGQGSPCLVDKSKVLGIVSTNSMAYDGTSPRFENGFLNYRVAGLHYLPGGEEEVIGTYDLVMRSDTARCLYGFSRAPVSATVTITGTGDLNVATTQVSESDGWLKLAAYGFTFSEKNIKVKVTQPQTRTLTAFSGRISTLSAKQKAEVKTVLSKSSGAKSITCTASYLRPADKAIALKRAQASCSYAKSLNKNLKTFAQAKLTKAATFAGKVIVASK